MMVIFAYPVPLGERAEIKARYDRLGIESAFADCLEGAAAETLNALTRCDATPSVKTNANAEGSRKD